MKKLFYATLLFSTLYVVLFTLATWHQADEADSLLVYVGCMYFSGVIGSFDLELMKGDFWKIPKMVLPSTHHTIGSIFAYIIFTIVYTYPVWANFFSLVALCVFMLLAVISFDVAILFARVPTQNTFMLKFLNKSSN